MNTFSRKPSRPDPSVGAFPSAGRGAVSPVQTLGAQLRERREAMGVTLAEVEVATRIRQKYLSALESEEWHMLPGEVVGRGFLRNYADYLGLDAQEIMERRRATTDMGMTQALSTTSAGAPLPPEREVDYRPKEVELKDEGDGIQRGEIRLTPILAIVAVAVVVGLGLWGLAALREPIGEMLAGAQAGVTDIFWPSDAAEVTPTTLAEGVVNQENVSQESVNQAQVAAMAATATAAAQGVVIVGSGAGTAVGAAPANGGGDQAPPAAPAAAAAPATEAGGVVLVPTATPAQAEVAPTVAAPTAVIEAPTATPVPPTPVPPTPTPVPPTPTPEVPTETPTPEPTAPPAVVAAACADPRSVISGPGVNQVIAGVATISGVATHETFQFFKLEFAPGANAGGGFTYFGGGQVQVAGGVLGNLDTTVLPNGEYTIRLTVVDTVGNFPPPCDVTVIVQN